MQDDPVIGALSEQLTCYRRLAKLAQIQHEHVRQGRIEPLLELLKRRQEVLDRLAGFETVVGPARRQWADYLATLEQNNRQRAESMLAETRSLLAEITLADKDDAIVLQTQKLNLGKQLNQASAARQVNRKLAASAYGRPPSRLDVQR
jgi:hypothetical protein